MKHGTHEQMTDATLAKARVASAAYRRRLLLRYAVILICYVCCVLYITLLSRTPSLNRRFDTVLFAAWRKLLAGDRQTGREALENIVLFIPFGYLAASLLFARGRTRTRTAVLTPLLGLALSAVIEAMQYYSGRGRADVDDLLHNTLGAALGYLALLAAVAVLAKWKRLGRLTLSWVLPVLMLLSGLAGCWSMRGMVQMTNLRTDQFWFSIDEADGGTFSGRCCLYDRPTPEYRIFLVRGLSVREAEVTQNGDSFTAERKQSDRKYEVRVRFEHYATMSTGVYLNGDRVEYVEGDVPEPDGAVLPPDAVLKAYAKEWDCYVYQSGTELIWLIGPDVPPEAELIYHIRTSRPELLPEQRVRYGFDNRGFHASDAEAGGYRRATRPVPSEYPVSSITVGLNVNKSVVWQSAFRP